MEDGQNKLHGMRSGRKKKIWEFVHENIIIYMNICIHTINGRKNLFNIIFIIKFEGKSVQNVSDEQRKIQNTKLKNFIQKINNSQFFCVTATCPWPPQVSFVHVRTKKAISLACSS